MVSYEVTFHQLSRWRGPRGPNKPNVWWEVVIDMHSQVFVLQATPCSFKLVIKHSFGVQPTKFLFGTMKANPKPGTRPVQ